MVVRSPMIADVGARIRALRTARGLTQAQVAQPSYTKAYISMLESGRTRASMKALEHIAGVLVVQPSDLLGGQAVPDAPQYQLVRLRYLATAYNADGHPKQAFPIIERAQKMAELLGDRSEQIRILAVLSSADIRTSAYDEGLKLLRECIAACESGALNDPPFLFRRFVDLGLAYSAQRQPKQALASFKRALAIGEQFALRRSLAGVYAGMAASHHELGDLELAIRFSQRSLDIYEGLGLLDRVACVLDNVALLYTEYGNRARAREVLVRAAALAVETQNDGTLASVQATAAEIMAKTDPETALESAQQALTFARKVGMLEAQVRDLLLIGELRLAEAPAIARRSFGDARALAEERAPHLLRMVYDRWSRAAEAAGDGEEALRLARRAPDASAR